MAKVQGKDKGNVELVLPLLLPLQQGTERSHTPPPAAVPAKKLQPKLLFDQKHLRTHQKCFLSKEELALPAAFPLAATQHGKANQNL